MTATERRQWWPGETVPLVDPAFETLFFPPEAVLLDARSGEVRLLNASAALVWLLIEPGATVDQLVKEAAGVTGESITGLRAGVETALEELAAVGVLLDERRSTDVETAPSPSLLLGPPEP